MPSSSTMVGKPIVGAGDSEATTVALDDIGTPIAGQMSTGYSMDGSKRVQVLQALNKFDMGATPSAFVGDSLGEHAIGKTLDTETSSLLTDEDYGQRLRRVMGFDKSCQDAFDEVRRGNINGDLKNMLLLPNEKELASIPVVAMVGGPFEKGRTEILGNGVVMLVENSDKKHRLVFSMSSETKGVEAKETWALSDIAGTRHVEGNAVYMVTRGEDRFLGFVSVEDALFDVQVKSHDEVMLKAIFNASIDKALLPGCSCFSKMPQCLQDCCKCLQDCCNFKWCCKELGGAWSLSEEFSEDLKTLVEAKIQSSTNNATYKFPECESLTNPEERAILVEFTRCLEIQYRHSNTNKVQICTLIVQPQVPFTKIAWFASMLSALTVSSGQEGVKEEFQLPGLNMPSMQLKSTWFRCCPSMPCCKGKGKGRSGSTLARGCCYFLCLAIGVLVILFVVAWIQYETEDEHD